MIRCALSLFEHLQLFDIASFRLIQEAHPAQRDDNVRFRHAVTQTGKCYCRSVRPFHL